MTINTLSHKAKMQFTGECSSYADVLVTVVHHILGEHTVEIAL